MSMPGFNVHFLAGALVALVFQSYPAVAFAILFGSVFPDIDSRDSITNRSVLLALGVLSMAVLYPHGLLVSVLATIGIVGVFLVLLPTHRGWLHRFSGQLLFGTICYLVTLDPRVFLAGILGTTIHRLLDRA